MKKRFSLVEFNQELPFIRAAIATCRDPYYIGQAARCLKSIEEKHGIEVLSTFEFGKIWQEGGYYFPKSNQPLYRDLVALCESHDDDAFTTFEAHYNLEQNVGDLCTERLYTFLSETELLLEGLHLQDRIFFNCEKSSSLAIGDFEAGVVSLRIGPTLLVGIRIGD